MGDMPLRVLVVDDEPAHAEAIRRALEEAGLGSQVRTVGTLREYQEAVRAAAPDIALLDLNLPDGRAMEALAGTPAESRGFPVLIMTSYGNEQTAVEALKAGALDYVVKSAEAFAAMPRTIAPTLREWNTLQERQRAEEALQEQRANILAILENTDDLIASRDRELRLVFYNSAFARVASKLFGIPAQAGVRTTDYLPPEQKQHWEQAFTRVLHGEHYEEEFASVVSENDVRYYSATFNPIYQGDQVIGMVEFTRDITARKQAEEQLRQAQKMETVGRLAGGVAHDFNNLLTVINGYSDFLLGTLPSDTPGYAELREIHQAGTRAASLTAQLLAFSRRQTLQPRVLDLNEEVEGMTRMLTRLIGEDIRLALAPASGLGHVRADPSQLQQVVLNLAVNARDAMPAGGTLTLETANVTLGAAQRLPEPDMEPGPYVLLTVKDTGVGMNDETKAHLFEPFYTTKGMVGTGLGLSMVYGIVKQSGGAIAVSSEVGQGTIFRIYLPRVEGPLAAGKAAEGVLPRGSETILVTEDNPDVRRFTLRVLQSLGYRALEASNGPEALGLALRLEEPIQLLLTDVIMPDMSGRDVAEQLRAQRPTLKVLFMSGYPDDAITHRGMLEEGMQFLAKPFRPEELARKVRAVLDMR